MRPPSDCWFCPAMLVLREIARVPRKSSAPPPSFPSRRHGNGAIFKIREEDLTRDGRKGAGPPPQPGHAPYPLAQCPGGQPAADERAADLQRPPGALLGAEVHLRPAVGLDDRPADQ